MSESTRKFTVILDREPNGGYSVYCPSLRCSSQGKDRADALAMIKEAIELVWEVFEERKKTESIVADFPLAETAELIAEELREALEFRLEEGDPVAMELVGVEAAVPALAPV